MGPQANQITATQFSLGILRAKQKMGTGKLDKVCKPKKSGGLGICDPYHSNAVMGAKICWQWLSAPHTPWAFLWISKYANHRPTEDLICLKIVEAGSQIWNTAKHHRFLIHEHSFWETRADRTARFWMDSWQQRPRLVSTITPQIRPEVINRLEANVNHYWTTYPNQGFRQWKWAAHFLNQQHENSHSALDTELNCRKIRYSEEKHLLKWGYTPSGKFSTQEAHTLLTHSQDPIDPIWDNLWSSSLWPKVSTFMWLLCHKRILTWDNLIKRGFTGPSRCPNCTDRDETIQHLMVTCPLAAFLWEKIIFRCRREGRTPGDLNSTIRNWPSAPYSSNLLNSLWRLIPGLTLWTIWKERNKRIFKNQRTPQEVLWNNLRGNI